jgi:hypothetical protein
MRWLSPRQRTTMLRKCCCSVTEVLYAMEVLSPLDRRVKPSVVVNRPAFACDMPETYTTRA